MKKIFVAPSLLSADFSDLKNETKKVESADILHIDVMDGVFVPNITLGAKTVNDIRKYSELIFDVHLMTVNPIKHVKNFAKAGADIITFHYEAAKDNVFEVIDEIKSFGKKAGLSIKPQTNPEEVIRYLDYIDLFLVMTVEPGAGGQKFMPDSGEKVKVIREKAKDSLLIEVDGGINAETGKICADNGADILVAGSYVYKSEDIEKAINSLRFEV